MKHFRLFNSGRSLLTRLTLLLTFILGGATSAFADGKTLPYSYGFENNNLAGEGWTTSNIYSGYTGIISSIYRTGSYCFRFSASSDYTPQYLISPELTPSPTGIDVSFYYRSLSSNYTTTFYVGHSTKENPSISDFDWEEEISYKGGYTLCSYSFETGTKHIAIKYTATAASCHLYIDDIYVSAINPYKTPTNFSISSYTENSATFSWSAGNSETAWQFAYSTSSSFTPGTDGTTLNITANPYTLSGLDEGTTYYAAIRADYGGGHYSEWTDMISFVPRAEFETDINMTTSTNAYVPFYGSSASQLLRSQFIIPSSSLSAVSGRQITKLTFYSSTSSKTFGKATFEVYLNEVSNTTYSTSLTSNWGVKVFNSAAISVSGGEMEIEFDTPYNYNGGNLQIGIKQTTAGTGSYLSWYALSSGGNTCRYHNDGANSGSYVTNLPKMTITSTTVKNAPVQIDENGFATFASPWNLDLGDLPDGLTAYKATLVHKVNDNDMVRFTEAASQVVPANTGLLLAGTAGSTYYIPVSDESGSDLEGNLLRVNTDGGTFTPESGYTYFGMVKNSDPLTFAAFDPTQVTIPSNKAYLEVELPADIRQLVFSFGDDEETGINSIENGKLKIEKEAIYNLAGQRVEKPVRGLYIVNGKKMVVK